MPPAKKTAAAAKRSRVMGGAEDEVITDATPPAEASDPTQSSRAKEELFGDAPKTPEGERTGGEPLRQEDVTADKPADAVETELSAEAPPERHEHTAHESENAVEADADYDAEEVEAKP